MPRFAIKIIGSDGASARMERDAADEVSLRNELTRTGVKAVSISAMKKRKSWINFSVGRTAGLKIREKIIFAHNMGTMLVAGLTISRVLSVLEKQARNTQARTLFSSLSEDIRSGKLVSDALKRFPRVFPSFFVSMVRAGEESGKLAESLTALANQMEKVHLLKKRLRGALIYPAVVITLMILVAIILLIFVVPTLTATFEELNVELPVTTRIVIFTSSIFQEHYIAVLAALVVLAAGFVSALHTARGRELLDALYLRIPLIGVMVREYYSAQTARTLSSLLSSGVNYIMAVEITRDVIKNSKHRAVLALARSRIERGEPISKVFSEHERVYPPFVGEMIAVGEETGTLSDMLTQIAEYYEAEVDQKTRDLSTVIEPVLMVIVGVAVAFFAIAMISPTYSVFTNI